MTLGHRRGPAEARVTGGGPEKGEQRPYFVGARPVFRCPSVPNEQMNPYLGYSRQ